MNRRIRNEKMRMEVTKSGKSLPGNAAAGIPIPAMPLLLQTSMVFRKSHYSLRLEEILLVTTMLCLLYGKTTSLWIFVVFDTILK